MHQANCILTLEGDVKCWGSCNIRCGMGNPGIVGMSPPSINLGTDANGKAISVSMGLQSGCAVFENGRIKCWGRGDHGQLGYGDVSPRYIEATDMGDNLPWVDLGLDVTAVSVESGWMFNCAILSDGGVKCWGFGSKIASGSSDNIGDNAGEMGDALLKVDLGAGRTAVQICLGKEHACAILDDRSLKCWGLREFGLTGHGFPSHDTTRTGTDPSHMPSLGTVDLGTGRTARHVSCGQQHTCVVLDDGSVKCFGKGVRGELGLGEARWVGIGPYSTGYSSGGTPYSTGDSMPVVDLGPGLSARSVHCGGFHTCAHLTNGGVKCWGYNQYGMLGQGSNTNLGGTSATVPSQLPLINFGTGLTAKCIWTGEYHTCILMTDDRLKCFGNNGAGELGFVTGSPSYYGVSAAHMGDNLPFIDIGATPCCPGQPCRAPPPALPPPPLEPPPPAQRPSTPPSVPTLLPSAPPSAPPMTSNAAASAINTVVATYTASALVASTLAGLLSSGGATSASAGSVASSGSSTMLSSASTPVMPLVFAAQRFVTGSNGLAAAPKTSLQTELRTSMSWVVGNFGILGRSSRSALDGDRSSNVTGQRARRLISMNETACVGLEASLEAQANLLDPLCSFGIGCFIVLAVQVCCLALWKWRCQPSSDKTSTSNASSFATP